jgi:hypothetical protein
MPEARRMATATLTAALAIGGVLLLATSPASADSPPAGCKLSIVPATGSFSINGYDPFEARPAAGTFHVIYKNTGDATCDFYTAVTTEGEPLGLQGPDGQLLPYTFVDDAGVNQTPFSQNPPPAARRRFTIGPGRQESAQYELNVSLVSLPADGTYVQRIEIEATDANDLSTLAEQDIDLELEVLKTAVMSLRGDVHGEHGGADVDLGELKQGPVDPLLSLFVKSTGGYHIEAESENHGFLKLEDSDDWTVAYSLVLGTTVVDLSGGGGLSVPDAPAAHQDNIPIGFTIGDVANRRAGVYRDVITLSIEPL